MNQNFIAYLFCICLFSTTACSQQVEPLAEHQQSVSNTSLSAQDQLIIKKYKEKIEQVDLGEPEKLKLSMQQSLGEIHQIQDKYEREKMLMNIYLSTAMYQEAYELNTKILKDSPFIANYLMQCELIYKLKKTKQEYEACHAHLAREFQKELSILPKDDPEYQYSEWGYLLSMYKAGHDSYQPKLKSFLDKLQDAQIKYQLQSAYELAVEQRHSLTKNR